MNLLPLLKELEEATGASERLDAAVALAAGYRASNSSDVLRNVRWLDPMSNEVNHLPRFTAVLDHALQFLFHVDPNIDWGCSWEKGKASAVVSSSHVAESTNPALAICIAAIRLKLSRLS